MSSGTRDPEAADRVAFVRLLHDAFLDAAERAGRVVERDVRIAGEVIRLRFAGGALVDRTVRALAHLSIPADAAPALTVCLWDSASTGARLPLLVRSLVRFLETTWLEDRDVRGEVRDYTDERVRCAFGSSRVLSVLDVGRRLALCWCADASELPYWETGAPLRTILHWWLGDDDRQLVHGGAVGTDDGGVLLAGRGGSGKSTTALACLLSSPLGYAGDDYTLVETRPRPRVHSLYSTAKLKGKADVDRFPELASWVCNDDRVGVDDEKPMMFVHEHRPEKVTRGFPLSALVFPRFVEGEGVSLQEISRKRALEALAGSTIWQLPGAGRSALRVMAALVAELPRYLLAFGTDPRAIVGGVLDVLARRR